MASLVLYLVFVQRYSFTCENTNESLNCFDLVSAKFFHLVRPCRSNFHNEAVQHIHNVENVYFAELLRKSLKARYQHGIIQFSLKGRQISLKVNNSLLL